MGGGRKGFGEKVIVEQIISFKRERRPWLQPSWSRQVQTLRCQQLKINKILSAPNLLGHILLAVLLPREAWQEMDSCCRSFPSQESGHALCQAVSILRGKPSFSLRLVRALW